MRRWLPVVALYVGLTLAFAYPLLAHFATAFPHDAGDPILNSWILWWSTQRLPFTTAWWNAPMFYPAAGVMALSEVLVGLLPLTAPIEWLTHNPIAAYNVAFLLSFPLCALAAFALALELTGRRDAAVLAGVAFAFAPYRMGQLSHVQMLSYYWAPLALLGLHRYLRTRQPSWLWLFGLSWLMQALCNGYAMFHLSVLIALWILWFARPLRTAVPIVVAWVAAGIPVLPMLLKYRDVHTAWHLVRDINEIKRFGADLGDILSAPPDVLLWGARLWTARPETAIFPGVSVLLVAVVWGRWAWRRRDARTLPPPAFDRTIWLGISIVAGIAAFSVLAFGPWRIGPLTVTDFHKPFSIAVGARLMASLRSVWLRRAWQSHSVVVFYVVAMFAMYALALGPEPRLFGRPLLYEPPYAWLMRLPGFDTLRVPARFAMLAVLCQSMLLAYAVARWPLASRRPWVILALGMLVLADGWARLPVAAPPPDGPTLPDGIAAVLELPPGETNVDFAAIFHGMQGGPPVVNGYSGYSAPQFLPLVHALRLRQFSALYEIDSRSPLGVVVDRTRADAGEFDTALSGLDGVRRAAANDRWATYIVAPHAHQPTSLGPLMTIAGVSANRMSADVGRTVDGDVETAWYAGPSQIGDEEIVIDLGSPKEIGAIVLNMGAYAFGFPRELEIAADLDDVGYTSVWQGSAAVLAVRAAISDAGTVPVTFDVGRVVARHLRLRQQGAEPGIPWWVPEIAVHAPAAAR